MLPALRTRFDALEMQRTALLTGLASHPASELERKPAPDRWSVLEILEHLVRADEGSVRQLERRDAPAPTLPARLAAGLKLRIIRLILGRVRLKVPVKGLLPGGQPVSLAELSRRWGESRCRLAGYLETIAPEGLRAPLFRHPIAGWLTLEQGLDFHLHHVGVHRAQIDRLVAR